MPTRRTAAAKLPPPIFGPGLWAYQRWVSYLEAFRFWLLEKAEQGEPPRPDPGGPDPLSG